MDSFFSTPQAKHSIELMYHKKLEELPITFEFQKIETSYGDTNVIITGEKDNPPLVLIHGSNGCAPIAIEAMIGLVKDFRVYAIDVIGQPNLSAETRPSMKDDSYGKWMSEILIRLNVRNAILVGISFGGFISWKTLVFDARRIAKAFLIVPAGIVEGNPLKALRRVFLPMKLYKWRKRKKYVHQFLEELFTEPDEFAANFLAKVFLHFEMDFSPIPKITAEEAKKITTPIYTIASKKDLFFPGEKMLKRSKEIFASHSGHLLLKESKHVPDQKDNEQIIELIRSEIIQNNLSSQGT